MQTGLAHIAKQTIGLLVAIIMLNACQSPKVSPAKLADIVNISDKYIVSGSFILSPNLNAPVGEVGFS